MNVYHIGIQNRYFGLFSVLYKNHYDALGLTSKATQSEIKAAYYKLSMLYHPDKNKGSESASEKFKDITAAYEVLGNLKLRRLYDSGLAVDDTHVKGWGSQEARNSTTSSARDVRVTKGPFTGRTPIYDFDAWSRNHYGQVMERRAQAKARYEEKSRPHSDMKGIAEKENVTVSLLIMFSLFFLFSYVYRTSSLDEPSEGSRNKK